MPWIIQSILISVSLSMDAFAVSLSNGLTNKRMPVKYIIITALFFGLFQGAMPLIGYLLGTIFEEWIEVALPIIGFAVLSFLGIKMIVDSAKEIKQDKKERLALLESQGGQCNVDDNQEIKEENITDVKEEICQEDALATDGDSAVVTAEADVDADIDIADITTEDGASVVLDGDTATVMDAKDEPFKFSWKMLLIQSVATSIDALTVGLVYIGKTPVEVYVTFALIALITFGICTWGVFFGKKFGEKLKNKAGIFGGVILIALGLKTIIEFLIEKFA